VHQVLDEGFARVLWKRQADLLAPLAADSHRTRPPVKIVETHGHDVAGTEPQPGQQQQHCTIPYSVWLLQIA